MTSASNSDAWRRFRGPATALLVAVLAWTNAVAEAWSAGGPLSFQAYLTGEPAAAMIAYNPSGYDPRTPLAGPYPADDQRADLAALRPAFDGLVLYAYDSNVTPAILAEATARGFRAVLLGVWDPLSESEILGVAELVRRYGDRLALAVCIGNEGINDNRYDMADLERAQARLRSALPADAWIWITTSEPAGDYGWPPVRAFGDFLAPNIHPAIDRGDLDVERAVDWVRNRATIIATAAGKPVLVKETGIPHGGADPFTPPRQAAFWSAWLARGRVATIDPPRLFVSYAAAFEAFDAAWKAEKLQDAIEGAWGLLSVDRRPYPAFDAWAAARRHDIGRQSKINHD